MKKAEMEAHQDAYNAAVSRAKISEAQGIYRAAMKEALSAWEHVDGMMQYSKKYANNESPDIVAIDLVLRYAPLLLDLQSLAKLESLLAETRRITRNAGTDVPGALAEARNRISDNHRLWKYLEAYPETQEDQLQHNLGGKQKYWSSVLESWSKMGLVIRLSNSNSSKVSLATRMGQVVRGKCPSCAIISEAPKAMLLEPTRCPQCKSIVSFVILLPKPE